MFLLLSLPALANLAPPIDLQVKPCTVVDWCDITEEGELCEVKAGDLSTCQGLIDQGYTSRCTGIEDLNQVRTDVYCRNKGEHTAPADPGVSAPTDQPGQVVPPSQRRCSTVAAGGSLAVTFSILAVAGRRRD